MADAIQKETAAQVAQAQDRYIRENGAEKIAQQLLVDPHVHERYVTQMQDLRSDSGPSAGSFSLPKIPRYFQDALNKKANELVATLKIKEPDVQKELVRQLVSYYGRRDNHEKRMKHFHEQDISALIAKSNEGQKADPAIDEIVTKILTGNGANKAILAANDAAKAHNEMLASLDAITKQFPKMPIKYSYDVDRDSGGRNFVSIELVNPETKEEIVLKSGDKLFDRFVTADKHFNENIGKVMRVGFDEIKNNNLERTEGEVSQAAEKIMNFAKKGDLDSWIPVKDRLSNKKTSSLSPDLTPEGIRKAQDSGKIASSEEIANRPLDIALVKAPTPLGMKPLSAAHGKASVA